MTWAPVSVGPQPVDLLPTRSLHLVWYQVILPEGTAIRAGKAVVEKEDRYEIALADGSTTVFRAEIVTAEGAVWPLHVWGGYCSDGGCVLGFRTRNLRDNTQAVAFRLQSTRPVVVQHVWQHTDR